MKASDFGIEVKQQRHKIQKAPSIPPSVYRQNYQDIRQELFFNCGKRTYSSQAGISSISLSKSNWKGIPLLTIHYKNINPDKIHNVMNKYTDFTLSKHFTNNDTFIHYEFIGGNNETI